MEKAEPKDLTETKPTETKPTETKPTETKPETKPMDSKLTTGLKRKADEVAPALPGKAKSDKSSTTASSASAVKSRRGS